VTVPTTSGTGAEVTWAIVLTDAQEERKMGLGNRENIADLAIVDPEMAAGMPPSLTADTGLDALTHAVEGYTCTWHTDLTDGLCVQAARLIFGYLPRAVADGSDLEARERMHNAATCAGLGFGNAMASMAHAMGHVLGAAYHVPHGRAVALCLPYTLEYAARQAPDRLSDLAAWVGCADEDPERAALTLADRIRGLAEQVGNPTCIAQLDVARERFEASLEKLVDDAFNDTQMLTACRSPSYDEMRRLFTYAYDGRQVDF
jgi:alcohol dehydrogenase class IV